jgi:hypothetical protein
MNMGSLMDVGIGKQIKVIGKCMGKYGFPENDKGDVQLAVQFEISPNDPDFAGQYITYYQRLVDEKNFEFAWKSLRACGVASDTFEDLRGIDANEVELVIEAREWEGKKKVEVKFVNPVGGPELKIEKPASGSKLRALSAMGKAAAKKFRLAAASPVSDAPQFTPITEMEPVSFGTDGKEKDLPF